MSAQFRILESNYVFQDDCNIIASSENTNFPTDNLRKPFRSKVWRSSGSFKITSSNNKIDFKESGGGVELTASIGVGIYTTAELEDTIKAQLDNAGNETYTVSYSQATGMWTIATSGSYLSLLFSSGTNNANSFATVIGFNGTDQTGSLSYTGVEAAIHTEEGLVFDLSVTTQIDSFAIVFDVLSGIKLSSTASLYLQASQTNHWDAPPVDVSLTIDHDIGVVTHFFTATQSYRYWRLKIVDPHNTYLYVEVPKVFLAKSTQLSQTPSMGFRNSMDDTSVRTSTQYGHDYYDVYPLRRTIEFNFEYLEETDVLELERIYRRVGTSIPIAVALDPLEETYSKDRMFIYGRIRGAHTQLQRFYKYFDVPLTIEECI
jgi:hypothetical protein